MIIKENKDNYDLITVGMICLGKTEDDNRTGLIKMLSILLSAEMEVEDKKRRLHGEFDLAMTKEMEKEMINMCDYGQMVARKNLEKGKEQGLMEGILSSIKKVFGDFAKTGLVSGEGGTDQDYTADFYLLLFRH